MSSIIFNYILKNFLKTVSIFVIVFYIFGVLLNLFEEIEFFKNLDVNLLFPLMLTSIIIPSLLIKIFPFIIFFSSMWFMINLRNNKNLLDLKVFGFSNLKIFFIVAITSFFIGWVIVILISPITSTMSKYYEKTKANYSRDIDYLLSYTKNGLWIKENLKNKQRIITAKKPEGYKLIDVKIFHYDDDSFLFEKIVAKEANIEMNEWVLKDVSKFNKNNEKFDVKNFEKYQISSSYDYEKINNVFKNFETLSFLELTLNRKKLLDFGYNASFLNESMNKILTLPFFLFLMTGIASILTMNTLAKSDNFKFILLGIIISVIIFYLKDLSLALGKTDRIPLTLAIWTPIIVLSIFTFIGVLQINEK